MNSKAKTITTIGELHHSKCDLRDIVEPPNFRARSGKRGVFHLQFGAMSFTTSSMEFVKLVNQLTSDC